MRLSRYIAVTLMCLLTSQTVAAAQYPDRPVKVVIPFASGSAVDFVVRLIARRFQDITGQPMVIESRGGAAGAIAATFVAQAAADGYTLMAATVGQMSLNPHTKKTLPYDPEKSFVPITVLTYTNYVLVIDASLPAKDLKEFVELAKKNSDGFKIGSTGIGTPSHFLGAVLNKSAGIDITNVPYKGVGPALNDLVGGHVSAAFQPALNVKQLVESGKLRAIAASSEKRLPIFPEVPTFSELGYPDVMAPLWTALVAPAGTPSDVIEKLNSVVAGILRSPDVAAQLRAQDQEPGAASPAETAAFMQADRERWGRVVRDSGFSPN